MKNIISYTKEHLDTFDEREFCSIDSLILSWISYFHFPKELEGICTKKGMYLYELFRAEFFDRMTFEVWDAESSIALLTAMVASPRFRNIKISNFVEQSDSEEEKQFSAMTFLLKPDLCYVAFRGTDSTFVGWKEDFNMAFSFPVPSQLSAKKYLDKVSKSFKGTLLVGGHSKGGNLAVYSSMNSPDDVKERILRIYSHDGPGFLETVLEDKAFLSIHKKIEKTLPQSSIVGMLLEQQENFTVVKSNTNSFLQHNPFTWLINDVNFDTLESLSAGAKHFNATLNTWLSQTSIHDRERFIESLYKILTTCNQQSFVELYDNRQETIPVLLHAAKETVEDTKKFIFDTLTELFAISFKSFPDIFKKQ